MFKAFSLTSAILLLPFRLMAAYLISTVVVYFLFVLFFNVLLGQEVLVVDNPDLNKVVTFISVIPAIFIASPKFFKKLVIREG